MQIKIRLSALRHWNAPIHPNHIKEISTFIPLFTQNNHFFCIRNQKRWFLLVRKYWFHAGNDGKFTFKWIHENLVEMELCSELAKWMPFLEKNTVICSVETSTFHLNIDWYSYQNERKPNWCDFRWNWNLYICFEKTEKSNWESI